MRTYLLLGLPLSLLACQEIPEKIETEEPVPNITADLAEVDFGELLRGSLSTETIIISNDGEENLDITSISALPPFTSPSGGGITIEPGQNTSITVQFIPTDYSDQSGTLSIVSNDPDESTLVIQLSGGTIKDVDGDGHDTTEAGGEDCDDDDHTIYPGAEDEWYDGIDSDCAGNDDYDQDGDGYQTDVWNEDAVAGGGDCQDNSTEIYPGAPDIWYDGIDSNCDGSDDFDQDGDGSRSALHGRGLDCDDTDADINNSGVEAVNGLDDDCDGVVDNPVPAWNADKVITGSASGDKFGWTVAIGDLDEDGKDDLITAAKAYQSGAGGVMVFPQNSMPSGSQATLVDAYNYFAGSSTSDGLGTSLAFISDLGAGQPVLAVGAPGHISNSGRTYFLEGSEAVYGGNLNDAFFIIEGTSSSYMGRGLVSEFDLDGDGLDDVFGNYRSGSNNYFWLLYGDASHSGTINVSDVDARFSSTGIDDNPWRNPANVGDLDGDGLEDMVICDMQINSSSSYGSSSAAVLWGSNERYENTGTQTFTAEATTIVSASGAATTGGDGYQLYASCGIMPDWNGDGMDEFWGFFTQSDDNFTGIYVFEGSADWKNGGADLNPNNDASYFFVTGTSFGPVASFRETGDWDGDGISEVAVAFSPTPQNNYSAGRVWIISSQTPPGMTYTSNDAAAVVVGDDEYGQVYYGNILPAHPGDLNNDGLNDWVATDWGYTGAIGGSGGTTDLGAVYLTFQR